VRSSLLANLQRCVQCAVGFCNVVMCSGDPKSDGHAAFVSLKAKFEI